MRTLPSSKMIWTANLWPNEAGRVNWIDRKEFQATELVLWQELSQAQEELENISLEMERRDSELQAASQGLEVANQQAEDANAELDA